MPVIDAGTLLSYNGIMNIFKVLFLVCCLPIFGMLAYFLIWLTILINIVEEPLPENEEVVPDIIIDDTSLGE